MTDICATASPSGADADGATVLARRDRDGHSVVVVIDAAADGEPVDWAALAARPPHRVIFRRGRTQGDGAREAAEASALAAVEGPGDKDTALDVADRRLSMRERGEGQRRIEQIVYRPEAADFVEACGWCALSVRMLGRRVEPVLALYETCGRDAVETFFARWPFLFGDCETRAQADDEYRAAVAAAIGADERAVPEMLVGRVLLCHVPSEGVQRAREVAAMRVLLKRLREVEVPTRTDAEAMLWLASRMPPDWIPSDGDEAALFAVVAKLVRSLCIEAEGALSAATLISSAKGRWQEFYGRLKGPPDAIAIADMWKAFSNQVARPAVRHHAGIVADEAAISRYCAGLLFGAKSLPSIVEASDEWHRLRRDMDRAIGGGVEAAWPVPFSRSEVGVVVLVAAATSEELEIEGAALRHCVGGYVGRCMNGSSVIVSLRRRIAGGEARTSTAELSGWRYGRPWMPAVLQHRGPRNAAPPSEDAAALAEFVRRTRTERIVPLPDGQVRAVEDGAAAEIPTDAVSAAARYDWRDAGKVEAAFRQWERFLPAEAAARGPEWFADHAEEIARGATVG